MIDFINTGGAKQLQDSRFTDIMPENLSGQIETQAFAYALARQVEKLCVFADRARIYASIEFVPERLLDILAVELRTPAYHDNYPVSVKRELVAGTLPFYQRLGTPAAVEWIIRSPTISAYMSPATTPRPPGRSSGNSWKRWGW